LRLLHPRLAVLALRAVAGYTADADGETTRYALDEPEAPPPPIDLPAADSAQASPAAQEVAAASSAPIHEECATPCQPNAAAEPAAADETAFSSSTATANATTAADIPIPSAASPPAAQAPCQELLSQERQEFGSSLPARVNGASMEQAGSSRSATTVITAASLQGPLLSPHTAARGQDFEGVGAAARNELTYVQRRYKAGLRVMTVGSGEIKGLNLCVSVTPAVRAFCLSPALDTSWRNAVGVSSQRPPSLTKNEEVHELNVDDVNSHAPNERRCADAATS
jgi:hypothetical protein